MFKKRENVREIEEGNLLSPKFDNNGLIPVITTCHKTKEILMHGYMNVEALKKTIETKEAHYWSRSRKEIWLKGKTSGFVQKVKEIRQLMEDVVSPDLREALSKLRNKIEDSEAEDLAESLKRFIEDQIKFQSQLDRTIELLKQVMAE